MKMHTSRSQAEPNVIAGPSVFVSRQTCLYAGASVEW